MMSAYRFRCSLIERGKEICPWISESIDFIIPLPWILLLLLEVAMAVGTKLPDSTNMPSKKRDSSANFTDIVAFPGEIWQLFIEDHFTMCGA